MSVLTRSIDQLIGINPLDSIKDERIGSLLTSITNNLETRLVALEAGGTVTKESFLAACGLYLKMEEDIAGTGLETDSSSNGHTVSVAGDGDLTRTTGKVGFACSFPGTDSLYTPNHSTLKITNKASVLFAFDPNTDPGDGGFDDSRVVFAKDPTGPTPFNVSANGADPSHFNLVIGIGEGIGQTPLIPRISWSLCAVVFDGTQTGNTARLVVEVNGIGQTLDFSGSTIPASIDDRDANIVIGTNFDSNFIGLLDELAFKNGEFSVAERLHYFTNVNAGISPIP